MLLYAQRNRRLTKDREPKTATSTFTQLLSSVSRNCYSFFIFVQCGAQQCKTDPLTLWRALVNVRLYYRVTPRVFSRAQELCESRGGRPGLPVPNKPTVSVNVKQHSTTKGVQLGKATTKVMYNCGEGLLLLLLMMLDLFNAELSLERYSVLAGTGTGGDRDRYQNVAEHSGSVKC